jgi:hypothetical protein
MKTLRELLNQLNWRQFLNQPNPIAAALMAKAEAIFYFQSLNDLTNWLDINT